MHLRMNSCRSFVCILLNVLIVGAEFLATINIKLRFSRCFQLSQIQYENKIYQVSSTGEMYLAKMLFRHRVHFIHCNTCVEIL